jgi:hypothetical protein
MLFRQSGQSPAPIICHSTYYSFSIDTISTPDIRSLSTPDSELIPPQVDATPVLHKLVTFFGTNGVNMSIRD